MMMHANDKFDKCQAITDVTECRTTNSIHKRKAFDVTGEQVCNVDMVIGFDCGAEVLL